jgi:hypothetical protein
MFLRWQMSDTMQTAMWWMSFTLCGTILCVHFSAIQLANMPLSPLKLRLANVLDAYVNPYFTQRWNFFAPQPPSYDVSLIARARVADIGGSVVTQWIDITDPLIDAVRQRRLTPMFLVELTLSNAVISFENELASDPNASFEQEGKKYIRGQIPASINPLEMLVMRRVAVATLEIVYPGKAFDQIQLGLMRYHFPRFTERHKKEGTRKVQATLIDWQPATWVVPYCCVKAGVFFPAAPPKIAGESPLP